MAVLQPILDLAELLYQHGVRHAVISPGSRSAPITLAFVRHGGFQIETAIDERSGGFIGLGIAQQTMQSVVLICTSGSAVYNYAPAVAEAYFQQIPLIAISADRPQEWIHQFDGQTIFQNNIFGKHVKQFYQLPVDFVHEDSSWAHNRLVNEAYCMSQSLPRGPVHINIGIREPFYPENNEVFQYHSSVRKIEIVPNQKVLNTTEWHQILNEWDRFDRKLVAVGQLVNPNDKLDSLQKLSSEYDIPVVADVISNIPWNENVIRNHDFFLSDPKAVSLEPQLLITVGMSFISKELKTFIRKNPPLQHWHISEDGLVIDPFKTLTKIIPISPEYFFDQLLEKTDFQLFTENEEPENFTEYLAEWQAVSLKTSAYSSLFLENLTTINDVLLLDSIFKYLQSDFKLQLGNSMTVRYANVIGSLNRNVWVNCNRGTSGIDGCLSTAIGAAKVSKLPVYLILGDVSFLYDRNGLLQNSLPSNLKIIILNNDGGNIFSMIEGPANLPENGVYFKTEHGRNAKLVASDAGVKYFSVHELKDLDAILQEFVSHSHCSILELFTDSQENSKTWLGIKAYVKGNL